MPFWKDLMLSGYGAVTGSQRWPFLAVSMNPVWEGTAVWRWYPVREGDWVMPPDQGEEVFILLPWHLNLKLHVLLQAILEYSRKDSYAVVQNNFTALFVIIIILQFYLFIFGCAGSSLILRFFSSCGEWGLLSSCSAPTSCGGSWGCAGFSRVCRLH